MSDSEGPVGVLAFAVETFKLGPLSVRVARLAGMDPNFAILSFPLRSDRASCALELVFEDLLCKRGCAGVSLSPVSDVVRDFSSIYAAIERRGQCLVLNEARRQHTVMYLPESRKEYWLSLSRSRQKEIRRSSNKMKRNYSLRHCYSTPQDVKKRFESFVEQHTRQWQADGRGGHFNDWPGSREYYRDLVCRLSPAGHALVETHMGNEEVLTSRLTFLFGDRAYWRLTARTLKPDAVRMGVGKVALVERVQNLIDRDIRVIEAGAGEYDYKLSYGGQLISLRQIVVSTTRNALQMRLLLFWADLLDLFYYRIWFLKLAPRLRRLTGGRPPPLWWAWIRTRL